MKLTPFFLILAACALTGCVRVDVAGAISNFDRKSEALIVPIDTDDWKIYRAGDTRYVETKRVRVSADYPITILDPSFSQLPHANFKIEEVLQEQYYFSPDTGQKTHALPAYTVPERKPEKMRHFYPWYTVGNEYRPIRLMTPEPSPHRYWTIPASILAFVAIDIPGSIVLSTLSLPVDLCYGLSQQQQQQATIEATYNQGKQLTPQTVTGKPHSETAHMGLKALPKKEAKAHEAYARKIRAAAQACASIRVNTHRIRMKNPEMREYTLSDSEKNELCHILSAVQPLKYKEHVFISPSRQTTISLLDAKGNTLCRILEWDIGRLSFITQHNEVIISEEDYKRFMEIVK
jgi:hypothetical protein